MERFPSFTPVRGMKKILVKLVFRYTFINDSFTVIVDLWAFMKDIVNIFSVVIAAFAIRGFFYFHLGKGVAYWKSVMVYKPEEGFNFRGDSCFPDPLETDGVGSVVTLKSTC